jgi:hypothetical protein
MSEKRILINPELFKIGRTNKTRKNPSEKKIKIKNQTMKNETNILRHIRQKQDEIFKNIISENANQKETPDGEDHFESDFQKSLHHMEEILSRTDIGKQRITHNKTLRTSAPPPPLTAPVFTPLSPYNVQNPPPYGCLRGGGLPTYREWRHTLKNTPSPPPPPPSNPEPAKILSEMKQNLDLHPIVSGSGSGKKPTRQKRTIKRIFQVGKSKVYPKVGVLVSNRTLRTNTIKMKQELKQTPIATIRKFLVKKGFIKVGSNSPNDILRKMYESVSMICGEVQNHNPDYLLYNYLKE